MAIAGLCPDWCTLCPGGDRGGQSPCVLALHQEEKGSYEQILWYGQSLNLYKQGCVSFQVIRRVKLVEFRCCLFQHVVQSDKIIQFFVIFLSWRSIKKSICSNVLRTRCCLILGNLHHILDKFYCILCFSSIIFIVVFKRYFHF